MVSLPEGDRYITVPEAQYPPAKPDHRAINGGVWMFGVEKKKHTDSVEPVFQLLKFSSWLAVMDLKDDLGIIMAEIFWQFIPE